MTEMIRALVAETCDECGATFWRPEEVMAIRSVCAACTIPVAPEMAIRAFSVADSGVTKLTPEEAGLATKIAEHVTRAAEQDLADAFARVPQKPFKGLR